MSNLTTAIILTVAHLLQPFVLWILLLVSEAHSFHQLFDFVAFTRAEILIRREYIAEGLLSLRFELLHIFVVLQALQVCREELQHVSDDVGVLQQFDAFEEHDQHLEEDASSNLHVLWARVQHHFG